MLTIPRLPPVDRAGPRPTVSVVIPVHNCAEYLPDALGQVLAQLGKRDDAEIFVVDDASSDDPQDVVSRLGGERVRYVANPTNLGAVATFNRCLTLASGELVHLLHGDDAVLPGFYAAMEEAMADQSAVAAICRVRHVDAGGHPTYVTRSYRHDTGVWADALGTLAVSNRVRAPGIVVRRSAYEQVGGFRTDLPHAADWEMWTRLAAHGPVVFVDEALADYRRHDGSDTSARVLTGENVRERVVALGTVAAHLPADRRRRATRRGMAFTSVFAARTAASLLRAREWAAAGRQTLAAARCLPGVVRGVGVTGVPALSPAEPSEEREEQPWPTSVR